MRPLILFLFVLFATPVHAGTVSAADPRAAAAGQEMLEAGGSATDAALAMMLALTVVEPQSSGIGGGGFFVHHDAARGLIETIDGRETAPAAATAERFLGDDGRPRSFRDAVPGGLSVGVPGNLRLMELAHRRWGRLPWARLFAPAVRLADEGFEVTPRMARMIAGVAPRWERFPEIAALYAPDGRPLAAGARMRNPALAALLRRLAADGADAFYTGAPATTLIETVASSPHNPATITAADLAGYEAKTRPAVCAPYRRYRVCGMGPPSSGATTVLGILGMLERFDLTALGPSSPEAWHLIADAMRLAYADRDSHLADRDFVAVPVAGLIDPAYLARRSAAIRRGRALGEAAPGTPPGAGARTPAPVLTEAGTTHFVAVDDAGNVVSMTSTVEGPFGSQLVSDGMVLNNELTDFSFLPERAGAPVANRVEPGKRPLSSMSPTIVYDEQGQPIIAVGSAGGRRIIMHVAKTLIGMLDFGLDAEAAIALPNLYFDEATILVEADTPLAAMAPALAAMGHEVRAITLDSKLNAAERTAEGWRGAADARSEGVALDR